MPKWLRIGLSTVGSLLFLPVVKLVWKLAENAALGWGDDHISQLVQPMTPALQYAVPVLINWGPPVLLSFAGGAFIYRLGRTAPMATSASAARASEYARLPIKDEAHREPPGLPSIAPPHVRGADAAPHPPSVVAGIAEPQPEELSPSRIFTTATPDYLRDLCREHTTIQANKLIAPYIGQWMSVEGQIADVEEAFGFKEPNELVVTIWTGTVHVTVRFSSRLEAVSTLRKGDILSATGKIRRISELTVSLEDCEVVKASAPPEKP